MYLKNWKFCLDFFFFLAMNLKETVREYFYYLLGEDFLSNTGNLNPQMGVGERTHCKFDSG